MPHNQPSDKTDNISARISCGVFFDHLYADANPDLWLELRCIDPSGAQKPRVLWSSLKDTTKVFREAASLNKAGYSIYFAPCPRTERKGSAEAAALLPALWVDIDCDGNALRREQALEKLRAFPISPTAIIDSGGGWHAYWNLVAPLSLPDAASRALAEQYLRGLFRALGADPQYVKSVASIMRLPNSVNTKPEREGAVARFVEFYPERRVALNAFGWVLSQGQSSFAGQETTRLLPQTTLEYLAHGAVNGTRNKALFEAACQFRDAGYSQQEAEAHLTSRYVADGSGENPIAREREAYATIASVYRRNAREPIPPPRQQVEKLVARFDRNTQSHAYPSSQEITDAVRACAALDPVGWAAERKRLKAVCSDDIRMADLDRLYREARREMAKTEKVAVVPVDHYFELDGCMVHERQTERGTTRQIVADWTARVQEVITKINDDQDEEHLMRLQLVLANKTRMLDIPSQLAGDCNELQRVIAQKAGGFFIVRAGMHKHLMQAILKLSNEPPTRNIYGFVGWTHLDGKWVYVSPAVAVSDDGVTLEAPEVELEPRLRDYGMVETDWATSLSAFQTVVSVFPKELAPTLLAFSLLPILQRFFPAAAPKPAIHLVGTTGSGKSELASLMACFYGSFTRDTPPAQWGDTVNTVELLGYSLADALFWVDDYKTCYADERTFTRFLQSYSRGMGRGRLTREAKLRQERPCRGLLLSTGESTIEGEASILSRMLVLDIPPWEQRDPGGKALLQAEAMREHLSGFTIAFTKWIAGLADAGNLQATLAKRFAANAQAYRERLGRQPGVQANTGRMVQNWAVLLTVYDFLREFLASRGVDAILPDWQDTILASINTVQHERVGHLFADTLMQLLASGEAVLTSVDNPQPAESRVTIVGYRDDKFIYLLPDVTYRAVDRIKSLKFSQTAIASQLKEDGWLLPSGTDAHLSIQKHIQGNRVRVWRLKASFLSGDGGDSGDS